MPFLFLGHPHKRAEQKVIAQLRYNLGIQDIVGYSLLIIAGLGLLECLKLIWRRVTRAGVTWWGKPWCRPPPARSFLPQGAGQASFGLVVCGHGARPNRPL